SIPGEVVSREKLTRIALGRELSPYDRALDTHVSHLRNKLGKTGSAAVAIRSVRGAGYRLVID
ncbi:MAG: helix-turn-helix domain-containing protein, partial [Gammaproteobacteria bacterium]|nr:helix-turn-helix domain-containing protein [Gammaproteobacteria bacterium]